jgi:hypothetical protein
MKVDPIYLASELTPSLSKPLKSRFPVLETNTQTISSLKINFTAPGEVALVSKMVYIKMNFVTKRKQTLSAEVPALW